MATTKNTCEGHHRDNLTKGKCYHEHSHRYEEAGHENCVAMVPIFNHLEDEQMKEIAEVIQHVEGHGAVASHGAASAHGSMHETHETMHDQHK